MCPPQPHSAGSQDHCSGGSAVPGKFPHLPYLPVLVQGQLLGEELEEAGAVAAVLLCRAHNADGRDQKLDAGLCGSVHQ